MPDNKVGWTAMSFSEAVSINPKRTLPREGNVPFLDMASLPLHGAPVAVTEQRPISSGGAKFGEGDTLFARITPCAENGKLGFVQSISGGSVAQGSTEFTVMAAREGVTLPEYVRFLAGWSHVRETAIGLMEGTSGRQRVPSWAFDEIAVELPPLDEQRRIAEVLRSLDEVIHQNRSVSQQADLLWQELTESLIWDLGSRSPELLRPLGTALLGSDYGVNASLNAEGLGRPILRMGNIQDGQIVKSGLKFGIISDDEANALALRVGDILFNRTNSRELVGKVALVREPTDCLYASYIVRLTVDLSAADPYFIFALMHSNRAQSLFKSIATPGASQANINPSNLKKVLVPLPDLPSQRAIAEQLKFVELSRQIAIGELETLMLIRDRVTADLLSGRVRVPA